MSPAWSPDARELAYVSFEERKAVVYVQDVYAGNLLSAIEAVDAGVTVAPWTAAFAVGRVTAIPLDSIEGLAPRDSARLATDLTRLASGLADDTSSTFRGLPFVVLRAWRTRGRWAWWG